MRKEPEQRSSEERKRVEDATLRRLLATPPNHRRKDGTKASPKHEALSSKIDRTISSAIRLALAEDSPPRYGESLLFKFSKGLGEPYQTASVVSFPILLDEPNELVRIYWDFDDLVLTAVFREALAMAVKPFCIGGRKMEYLETAEGFKIVLRNDG